MYPIHFSAFEGWLGEVNRLLARNPEHLDAEVFARLTIGEETVYLATPLMIAGFRGHVPVVARLLALGADVHKVDAARWTAAHYACKHNRHEVLALLVRANGGRPPEASNEAGATPLATAATWGARACVEFLLTTKVNVDAATLQGDTALHHAAARADARMVAALLGAGADPTRKNVHGATPLDEAVREAEDGSEEGGACVALLQQALGDAERARLLRRLATLVDETTAVAQARVAVGKKGLDGLEAERAVVAAAPPRLKHRVAAGTGLPWVWVEGAEAGAEACVGAARHVVGVEGIRMDGGLGMSPDMVTELLAYMAPPWATR